MSENSRQKKHKPKDPEASAFLRNSKRAKSPGWGRGGYESQSVGGKARDVSVSHAGSCRLLQVWVLC